MTKYITRHGEIEFPATCKRPEDPNGFWGKEHHRTVNERAKEVLGSLNWAVREDIYDLIIERATPCRPDLMIREIDWERQFVKATVCFMKQSADGFLGGGFALPCIASIDFAGWTSIREMTKDECGYTGPEPRTRAYQKAG